MLGEESQTGPDLPHALNGHTMTLWNNTVMVTGGNPGAFFNKKETWILDNEKWVPGPPLNQGRGYHAAATGTDRSTQEPFIAVTGGFGFFTLENSVEILWRGSTTWQLQQGM